MMSVSLGMGADRAGGYFSKEDYYLRGTEDGRNSRWYGKGAETLGLDGAVREEEFRALCRGEDPAGNRIVAPKLTRDRESGALVESHRAGNDCTFSAPKSVSIAYAAGVDGVKEAHDAAVLSVLRHLEEHYCHYRSPEGILNGELVAAKFDHATSRNIDPQLHSHVFVVNAVRARDGSWKANEPRAIFQDQKSLGLLYRQALARELAERGFEVAIRDRSQMFIELKGIDPRLTEHFSTRREEIERQVECWRSEGKFDGVPHARLYEMAALETRDPKRGVTREEVAGIFERGFELCGTSVQSVKRELEKGRDLALSLPERLPDASRVVELAARDLTEREAVLDRARLLDQAARISGGGHTVRELDAAIDGGTEGVLRLGRDARGREFYTTPEMLELESRNLARIRHLGGFESAVSAQEVEGYLERRIWTKAAGKKLRQL